MRTNLAELKGFAFCPLFYKQAGLISSNLPDSISTIKTLITYLYSRQLEVGYKISWEETQNVWNRLWWKNRDLNDSKARRENNSALIGLQQVYQYYRDDERLPVAVNFPYTLKLDEHVILGNIPLILSDPEQVQRLALVDVGRRVSPLEMTRDISLRSAALMIQQSLGTNPTAIELLCFNRDFNLNHVRLYPTQEFQETSLEIFGNLLTSISQGFYYPNYAACDRCQFSQACIT